MYFFDTFGLHDGYDLIAAAAEMIKIIRNIRRRSILKPIQYGVREKTETINNLMQLLKYVIPTESFGLS